MIRDFPGMWCHRKAVLSCGSLDRETPVPATGAHRPLHPSFGGHRQCLVGLSTAYLANTAVCLVVYAKAEGPFASRSGWLITMMIVWPMALDVVWTFSRSVSPTPAPPVAGQGVAAGLRATRE